MDQFLLSALFRVYTNYTSKVKSVKQISEANYLLILLKDIMISLAIREVNSI